MVEFIKRGEINKIKDKTVWNIPVNENLACINSPVFKMKDHSDAILHLITWFDYDHTQTIGSLKKIRNFTIQLRLAPDAARNIGVIFWLAFHKYSGYYKVESPKLSCLMPVETSSTIVWCVEQAEVNFFKEFNKLKAFNIECEFFDLSDDPVYGQHFDPKKHEIILTRENKPDLSNCCENFEKLLSSGDFSDLAIRVVGGEIDVHKVILSTRNKKFKDLIESNIEKDIIRIVNVEIDVMKEILEFIYSGKVKKSDNMIVTPMPSELIKKALKILPHAIDYELSALVAECETTISNNLNADNIEAVLEILNKEEKLDRLRKFTISYLKKNKQLNTPPFRKFISNLNLNLELFDEVFYSLWKK